MIRVVLLVIFAAQFSVLFGQIEANFIKHLSENQLRSEHLTYLNQVKAPEDSVCYLKAKFYLQYEEDSLFFINFEQAKSLFLSDPFASTQASLQFFGKGSASRERWFETLPKEELNEQTQLLLNRYNLIEYKENRGEVKPEWPTVLLDEDYKAYTRVEGKSPFLGGFLSALIPGLGKLYAGKRKAFVATFFINGVHFVQTYESATRLDLKHPLNILNISVLAGFYVANIYGSYHDVKEVKRERKQQLYLDATTHYRMEFGDRLYQ